MTTSITKLSSGESCTESSQDRLVALIITLKTPFIINISFYFKFFHFLVFHILYRRFIYFM